MQLETIGKLAKEASYKLMNIEAPLKSRALLAVADALIKHTDAIMTENKRDVDAFVEKADRKRW